MLLHILNNLIGIATGATLMLYLIKACRKEKTIPGVFAHYFRRCPQCSIKLTYRTEGSATSSALQNKLCRSCCNRGPRNVTDISI